MLIRNIIRCVQSCYYIAVFIAQSKIFNINYVGLPKLFGIIVKRGRGKLTLGKSVAITSSSVINPLGLTDKCFFFAEENATIQIGDNVSLSNSLLYAKKSLIIQDNVLIGGGCQIFDSDFHAIDYNTRRIADVPQISPVLIMSGAFIGASTIILKGVTIGKESVVGAGSVVTMDVPDREVWAGNPARFVRNLSKSMS